MCRGSECQHHHCKWGDRAHDNELSRALIRGPTRCAVRALLVRCDAGMLPALLASVPQALESPLRSAAPPAAAAPEYPWWRRSLFWVRPAPRHRHDSNPPSPGRSPLQLLNFCPQLFDHSHLIEDDLNQFVAAEGLQTFQDSECTIFARAGRETERE